MSEMIMFTPCRPMLTAACLLAVMPLARAGDARFTVADGGPEIAIVDEGWVAGASGNPAALRAAGSAAPALRETGAGHADFAGGATDVFAGYHGNAGGLAYSATVHVLSYPGLHAGAGAGRLTPGMDGHAELSAGVNWKSLYARYDVSFTNDYFGIGGARGTGYLDVGARHPIGHATFLNLHAGDARVAGGGNGLWDWKDLRAGFTRKLEDGWTMVLNVRRVYGNSVLADRRSVMLRSEPHPAIPRGHRGLVLTFKRGF